MTNRIGFITAVPAVIEVEVCAAPLKGMTSVVVPPVVVAVVVVVVVVVVVAVVVVVSVAPVVVALEEVFVVFNRPREFLAVSCRLRLFDCKSA